MQASRISETDLNGLGEERSESEPLTRQVVQMSAPLAHHGTRHTGSLRLACATAFIHLTERTSSGQISILSKRALLELQNLLPSRDTIQRGHYEVPCCPHYGGLEKTVHSGPPSRGAAVGTLGTLSLEVRFQLASNCACAIILGPCNSHGAERERGTPLLVHRRVRDGTPRPVGTLQSNNTQNIWKSNTTCHLSSRSSA